MQKTKNFLALLMLAVSGITANAQTYWNGSTAETTTPGNCAVKGGQLDLTPLVDGFSSVTTSSTAYGLLLNPNNQGGFIQLRASNPPDGNPGGINFNCSNISGAFGMNFWGYHGSAYAHLMRLTADGNLGIGQYNPTEKLDVNGNIRVEQGLINITNNSGPAGWSTVITNAPNGGFDLKTNDGGAWLQLRSLGAAGNNGGINVNFSNTPGSLGMSFWGYNGASYNNLMRLTADGNLGIGQYSPTEKLDVSGNIKAEGGIVDLTPAAGGWSAVTTQSTNYGLLLNPNNLGGFIQLRSATPLDGNNGGINFNFKNDPNSLGANFYSYDNSGHYTDVMRISPSGQVLIGVDLIYASNPDGYNLCVSKGIITEKLKVALHGDATNWSDYVFNKDYSLMPLNKVEKFINNNKHLPDVPSANEVAKNGIDVATMDAKLLQKIEELTLYVIQQQKEIDELKGKSIK